jgi:hypothetical protein
MREKFAFLGSVRFWKLFLVAVLQFLATQEIVTSDIANAVSILLVGDVTINTVDRFNK